MVSSAPALQLGLIGFSLLERALLQQWLAAERPGACWVDGVDLAALPVLDGLVLDGPGGLRWCQLRQSAPSSRPLPALQLGAWPTLEEPPPVPDHFVVADFSTGAEAVRDALRHWLAPLQARGAPATRLRLRSRLLFSPREHDVLALLSRGHSNEEIAGLLAIRVPTVKTYLRRVFERTGALNRAHAVALYMAQGRPPA